MKTSKAAVLSRWRSAVRIMNAGIPSWHLVVAMGSGPVGAAGVCKQIIVICVAGPYLTYKIAVAVPALQYFRRTLDWAECLSPGDVFDTLGAAAICWALICMWP